MSVQHYEQHGDTFEGFLVNIPPALPWLPKHWLCVRRLHGRYFWLDSKKSVAEGITVAELGARLQMCMDRGGAVLVCYRDPRL